MSGSPRVRVSVIMLTFDRPQFLDRAIGSVLAQSFAAWELIVVHDGPNADIADIATAWVDRDPRIRYLHRAEKGNIANAFNFALARAQGDYVAILDDDDYWIDEQKLAVQVDFLDRNSHYVACGGGMVVTDPDGRELLRYLKREQDDAIKRAALIANPMAHSTTMFRARVNDQAVRYDEALPGFQDWDLWLRLGCLGRLYNFRRLFTCYTLWPGAASFNQQLANVSSAVKIVRRHRRHYRGAAAALCLTSLHYAYAHLPRWVRWQLFTHLSVLKKRTFADHPPARGGLDGTLHTRDAQALRGAASIGTEL